MKRIATKLPDIVLEQLNNLLETIESEVSIDMHEQFNANRDKPDKISVDDVKFGRYRKVYLKELLLSRYNEMRIDIVKKLNRRKG